MVEGLLQTKRLVRLYGHDTPLPTSVWAGTPLTAALFVNIVLHHSVNQKVSSALTRLSFVVLPKHFNACMCEHILRDYSMLLNSGTKNHCKNAVIQTSVVSLVFFFMLIYITIKYYKNLHLLRFFFF